MISPCIIYGQFFPFNYSPCVILINVGLDSYFHNQYPNIEETGNKTINKIISETAHYKSNQTRLIKIADSIIENFTDPYWPSQRNEKYFCYHKLTEENDEWSWCSPFWGIFGDNPRSYGYVYDKFGGVRTLLSNDLDGDPKWIAYQKTGACAALSVLFNETVNKSGFVSRIVHSDGAFNCGNHFWNEVLVGGEWKYYDLQRYGQVKNSSESMIWFGNRSAYGENSGSALCDITKFGVYVFDKQNGGYGENLTDYYDPTNQCFHGSYNMKNC